MCIFAALRAVGGVAHVDVHLVLQTIHKTTDFLLEQPRNGTEASESVHRGHHATVNTQVGTGDVVS